MRMIIPVLCLGILAACREPKGQTNNPPAADTAASAAITSEAAVTEKATAAPYPGNSGYAATILSTGIFHDDEVQKNDAQKHWIGFFKNDSGYYLAPVKVQVQPTIDPVVDEEGDMTGWEVKADRTDSAVLLIAGLDFLREGPVPQIQLSKAQLLPGDSVSFVFSGNRYVLHATGNNVKRDGNEQVENYQLYLSVIKEGHRSTELLAAQPDFDDNMIKILFAGDIDGDGRPDLLIDNSRHYNVSAPTLYLSKPAEAGHLLKVTGMHTTAGC